jgi:hypothetical protein
MPSYQLYLQPSQHKSFCGAYEDQAFHIFLASRGSIFEISTQLREDARAWAQAGGPGKRLRPSPGRFAHCGSFLCHYVSHALSEGFYSQVIVVSALERFKLFYGLIGFVVHKGRFICLEDFTSQKLHAQRKWKLLENLDIIDIVKEI